MGKFDFQQPHGSLKPSIAKVLGDLHPFLTYIGSKTSPICRHECKQNSHNTKIKNKSFLKGKWRRECNGEIYVAIH